jgi:hypothetical protein
MQLCKLTGHILLMLPAGDTKRLQALEIKMMGSCSAPSGFAFMSLPGEWEGRMSASGAPEALREHRMVRYALH